MPTSKYAAQGLGKRASSRPLAIGPDFKPQGHSHAQRVGLLVRHSELCWHGIFYNRQRL